MRKQEISAVDQIFGGTLPHMVERNDTTLTPNKRLRRNLTRGGLRLVDFMFPATARELEENEYYKRTNNA